MKKLFLFSDILLLLALGFAGNAQAKVECAVFQGTSCADESSIVYRMRICDDTSFNNGTCRDHCRMTKPICNVEDFSAWTSAYRGGFDHHELGGSLTATADNFDEDGTLGSVSEKPYTVCMRDCGGALGFLSGCHWSGWSPITATVACPKSKAANCTAGTIYNPATGSCTTGDGSCGGTDNSQSFAGTVQAGLSLIATQNNHFTTSAAIDPNQNAATAGPTGVEGLTTPTRGQSGAGIGGASSLNPGSKTSGSGSGSSSEDTLAANAGSGSAFSNTGDSQSKKNSDLTGDPSMLASTYLGTSELIYGSGLGSDSGGKGGSGGAGGGGSSGSGAFGDGGWFGSKGAATPRDGASAEVGFSGEGGSASRGLASASGGRLSIEDPADYFMRAGIDLSLFKRVTAQHRKKEKDLVLSR